MVGETLATRLVELGHEVMMGARETGHPHADAWAAHHAPHATAGTFEEAADFGTFVILATAGHATEQVAERVASHVDGKVLIDVTNPLEFPGGSPTLFVGIDDSLGERVQRAAPGARVVKTLNTVNAAVMVRPADLPGDHLVFVASDHDDAKAEARTVLQQFGWDERNIVDLGGLDAARATEAYLLLWLRLVGRVGHARFNLTLAAAPQGSN
jgi:predicted dinucleotide-binding enzyme